VLTVLGNHDLHLLVRATGDRSRAADDNLDEVLDAPDAGELIDWLRRQPLAHHDPALNALLVHAGRTAGLGRDTVLDEAARVERRAGRRPLADAFSRACTATSRRSLVARCADR
jgi:bis(5'-nucleosyl)-tetraphosphatase (symmetrical)